MLQAQVKGVVRADITFPVKEMGEGMTSRPRRQSTRLSYMDLPLRKDLYPYDYMDKFERPSCRRRSISTANSDSNAVLRAAAVNNVAKIKLSKLVVGI